MGEQLGKRHDYTNEIVTTLGNKFKYVEKGPDHQAKKKIKITKPIIALVLVMIIAVGATWLKFYLHRSNNTQILKNISQSVNFNLYYPSLLPEGYNISKGSFGQGSNVVTFYAENSRHERLFFSEQPLPDKTAMDDFNKRALQDKTNVISDAGQASIGTLNNKPTGSLATAKTWVLVITSNSSQKSALSSVLSALRLITN